MKIQAIHDFHESGYAEEWARKFKPTDQRLDLFQSIWNAFEGSLGDSFHILELGIGPGYLADFLLARSSKIIYEGVDYSEAMLRIASKRLGQYESRTTFTQADLTVDKWINKINYRPSAVVTTWTLHDLFNAENISLVYQKVFEILPIDGLFLNGDFIKPQESKIDYEGGRLKPSDHLELLKSSGFRSTEVLREFEKDIISPTTANNYALFLAMK